MPITALNASTFYYFTGDDDGFADAGVLLRCCCGAVNIKIAQSEVGSEDWLRLARACRDGVAASAGTPLSPHTSIAIENGVVAISVGASPCDVTCAEDQATATTLKLPAAVCMRAFAVAYNQTRERACEAARRAFAAGLDQVPAPTANLK